MPRAGSPANAARDAGHLGRPCRASSPWQVVSSAWFPLGFTPLRTPPQQPSPSRRAMEGTLRRGLVLSLTAYTPVPLSIEATDCGVVITCLDRQP